MADYSPAQDAAVLLVGVKRATQSGPLKIVMARPMVPIERDHPVTPRGAPQGVAPVMMRIGRLGAALAVAVVLGFGLSQPAVAVLTPNSEPLAVEVHLVEPVAMKYAAGHLFVTDLDSVVVLNLDGSINRIIGGMFGASGMALSPDGSKLYVALSGGSKIAVIDTVKRSLVATWQAKGCPDDVALVGSRLFYSSGCEQDEGSVSSLNAETGADPQPTPIKNLYSSPMITAGGNTLVVDPGEPTDTMTVYRVTGASLRRLSAHYSANESDDDVLAVSADGRQIIDGSSGLGRIDALDARRLTPVATYPCDDTSTAVSLSHNGKYVAAGFDTARGVGLAVFNRRSGRNVLAANTTEPNVGVLPRRVDFSEDDRAVYALLGERGGDSKLYLEHVSLSRTTGSAPTTLGVEVSQSAGTAIQAIARLTGVAKPARITFIVTDGGGTRTFHAMAGPYRDAAVTFSPAGNGTVSAIYAGDRTHAPATAEAESFAAVIRGVPDLQLDLPDSITPGEKVVARAKLDGAVGAQVVFAVQTAGVQRILHAVTGANGIASVSFVARSAGTVRAIFSGNAAYEPATVSRSFVLATARPPTGASSSAVPPSATPPVRHPSAERAAPRLLPISWWWAIAASVILAAAALATGRMSRRNR